MSKLKILVTIVILAGMVVSVVVLKKVAFSARNTSQPAPAGRITGDPKAKVKIVEFTDFQCPACAKAAEIMHSFEGRDARVSLELKYFPLDMHRNARRAALAAQCASEQGKFWAMHNVLFRSQKSWADMDDPDRYFLDLARGLGMGEVDLMKCMAQPLAKAIVEQDVNEGKRLGVKATPTFYVNEKMIVGVPAFEKALKEALQ
ncbi:MAG: thioredoxin domain-containing protein [Candidatus Omnitrophica bacterium]|nr:thioredoxin domain-containing protein [Candidatus Omnitrophota bacterium]